MKIHIALFLILFSNAIYSKTLSSKDFSTKPSNKEDLIHWQEYSKKPILLRQDFANLQIEENNPEKVVLKFIREVVTKNNDVEQYLVKDINPKLKSKLMDNIKQGKALKTLKQFTFLAKLDKNSFNKTKIFRNKKEAIEKEIGKFDLVIFCENEKQGDYFFFLRKVESSWKIVISLGVDLLHY